MPRQGIEQDGTVRQDGEFQPEATAPRCPRCGGRHRWVIEFRIVTRESLSAERAGEVAATEDH